MYKSLIKPILFLFSPERAHYIAVRLVKTFWLLPLLSKLVEKYFVVKHPALERTVFGIRFSNPVGLAAGFDKNASVFNEFSSFGFGFVEIGTVTPKPQPGNEKPRMFRLPEDEALINRMGFNNDGAEAAAENLSKKKTQIIIGGNIGKNKTTANEEAVNDYLLCFEALYNVVDYFAINVSSPNTPGLRALQDKEPLKQLLNAVQELNYQKPVPKPVLLKIAPDLTNEQLDEVVEIVRETKLAGIIATNTTISRHGLKTKPERVAEMGAGGLSGKPLNTRSTEVIRYLKLKSDNGFAIIGVGGIHCAADAIEKLEAGADLVQVYTGFIYEGPSLVKNICKGLIEQANR